MGSNGSGFQHLHFSTANLAPKDRIAVWREEFGRDVLRLDIEPVPGVSFSADLTVYPLPGLSLVSAAICGTRERRTRELVADGNDAIGLAINLSGPFIASGRNQEVTLGEGDAILASCAELGTFTRPSAGRSVGICIPRAALAALVPNVEDMFARAIPRGMSALSLLSSYIARLLDDSALATSELQHLAVTHVYNLVALTIGAPREVFLASAKTWMPGTSVQPGPGMTSLWDDRS